MQEWRPNVLSPLSSHTEVNNRRKERREGPRRQTFLLRSRSGQTRLHRRPAPDIIEDGPRSQGRHHHNLLPQSRRLNGRSDHVASGCLPCSDAACLATNAADASTFPLKIGGLFLILTASLVGALLPLFSRSNKLPTLYLLARAFAAGIVLATGIIHVLPDSQTALSNPCLNFNSEYPWAFTLAGLAILMTLCGEVLFSSLLQSRLHLLGHGNQPDAEQSILDERQQAYSCMQATLVSYTLEAGIIFHSIFIGISYGASVDMGVVRSLTVALCFHQAFEGLALGSSFVAAAYSNTKYILFAAAFVLITPAGVAIGLAVSAASSFNENSKAALASEGAFNAVSAGILIYTAVVDLLHPMFFDRNSLPAIKGWVNYAAMVCAFAGFASMAVVAIWA